MDKQSRHLELHLVLLLLLGIMLGGCAQPTVSPTVSPSETQVMTPDASLTPTATLSPISTPTLTATLPSFPFPPEPEATHVLTNQIIGDVFFGSPNPECPLPCWHGLNIGYATSNDVFSTFDRVFNFGGLPYVRVEMSDRFPDHYLLYHVWEQKFKDGPWLRPVFSTYAWVNRDTDKLEMLSFGTVSYSYLDDTPFYPDLTLGKILRELGRPLYWYMKGNAGGQGEGAHIQFSSLIVYANGVSFYHNGKLPTQLVLENDQSFWKSQLCMNDQLEAHARIHRRLISGFSQLSALEQEYYAIRNGMGPIEDMTGMTSLELVERVEAEANPCIEIKLPQR